MTRTSDAREHLFSLYRSGTATPEQLAQAQQAYDDAATAEGVQAAVDTIGALTHDQRRILAVLLAPPPTGHASTRRPARTRRRSRTRRPATGSPGPPDTTDQ